MLVVVTVLARSAFASDAAAYQTATVAKRDVDSVLDGRRHHRTGVTSDRRISRYAGR